MELLVGEAILSMLRENCECEGAVGERGYILQQIGDISTVPILSVRQTVDMIGNPLEINISSTCIKSKVRPSRPESHVDWYTMPGRIDGDNQIHLDYLTSIGCSVYR